ncbi:MAG TPA: prolipoprotein diacylglyceryl transferase [Verrucomicrobiae bacterium]
MHPIAFHIGSLKVHWYGVMMALAFVLGLWTASRRGLRENVPVEKVLDIGPWIIIGTIVGARILHVVTYWKEEFADQPIWEIFMVQHGGLVFYGGLIGASLACIIYVRWKKIPLWKMADILAPSIALGYVFGRIGCLLNGCCYGRACSLPWAVTYPAGHETHPFNGIATPVHPTQIYDSLMNVVLYVGLAWLFRRKKFDGQVFAAYLIGYSITRSIAESFRGDYSDLHIHDGLTPAHLISIGIFIIGIALFVVLRRMRPAPRP